MMSFAIEVITDNSGRWVGNVFAVEGRPRLTPMPSLCGGRSCVKLALSSQPMRQTMKSAAVDYRRWRTNFQGRGASR